MGQQTTVEKYSDHEMEQIKPYVDYLLCFSENETDWFRLKVQLVNLCPPKVKKLLSRRHYSTKKHCISDMDKKIIEYIEATIGKVLFIDNEKLHNPDWVSKPKGWALQELNAERQKNKK
jgi:hypothetical protein